MDRSKPELFVALDRELDAMRGRARRARELAKETPSQEEGLIEHAATIERAVISLGEVVRDIKRVWKSEQPS